MSVVGPIALKTMPRIRQVFIESQAGLSGDELERELFIVRKLMEKEKVRSKAAAATTAAAAAGVATSSKGGGSSKGGASSWKKS